MAKKKEEAGASSAEELVTIIRKKFGKTAASIPGKDDPLSNVKGVIPCGIDVVDRYVFGCGGAARGRISEVFSEPGVAKSTFLKAQLGGCQKMGGTVVLCASEPFDAERSEAFGLDLTKLVLLEPFTLEAALEQMKTVAESLKVDGPPVIIAWDSLAGAAYGGDLTQNYVDYAKDDRAAKIGSWIRTMNALALRKAFHLLIVNQTREKRGVWLGNKTTTPGGDGPKFFASLRLQLFSGKALKDKSGDHVGKAVTFFLAKSRFSPPFRKAKVRLDYEHGWDNLWSTVNHAKDLKLIPAEAKYSKASYAEAVKALGWKDVAEPVEAASTEAEVEDGDVSDIVDVELAEFVGEPLGGA